ncbi:type VI secretion system baseplate subunit TssF [Chromobacterium subtsugae]
MLESLLSYYERELGHLRELSCEFLRRYPKIASRCRWKATSAQICMPSG